MLSNTNKINLELLNKGLRDSFYLDDEYINQIDYDDTVKYANELGIQYYPINKK